MNNIFKVFEKRKIGLPDDIRLVFPELHPTGRRIIETCLRGGNVEDYLEIIPMDYQYSFLTTNSNE